MARLPVVGGDRDNWGVVLNDYLSVEHNPDGTLKLRTDGSLSDGIADGSVTASKLSPTVNSYLASAQTAVQSVNGETGQAITLTAADISGAVQSSQLGAVSGVATLDGSSKLTSSQVPNGVPNGDFVSVAVGAGLGASSDSVPSHPLSETYSTLAEAQADYSFVTSLSQERDWAEIQKKLNDLPTGYTKPLFPSNTHRIGSGGTVQLERKAYNLGSDSLQINTANTAIVGQGALLHYSGTGDAIIRGNFSPYMFNRIVLRDFTLRSTYSGSTPDSGGRHGINITRWVSGECRNVLVYGFRSDGIVLPECQWVDFHGVESIVNGGYGFRIDDSVVLSTTLSSGISAAETGSLVLASGTGVGLGAGELRVGQEIIGYASRSGTTYSTLTRGLHGTSAAVHSGGAAASVMSGYRTNNCTFTRCKAESNAQGGALLIGGHANVWPGSTLQFSGRNTTTTAGIGSGDTSIPADTTGFAPKGWAVIENEVFWYDGLGSGSAFENCIRGAKASSAAAHSSGVRVSQGVGLHVVGGDALANSFTGHFEGNLWHAYIEAGDPASASDRPRGTTLVSPFFTISNKCERFVLNQGVASVVTGGCSQNDAADMLTRNGVKTPFEDHSVSGSITIIGFPAIASNSSGRLVTDQNGNNSSGAWNGGSYSSLGHFGFGAGLGLIGHTSTGSGRIYSRLSATANRVDVGSNQQPLTIARQVQPQTLSSNGSVSFNAQMGDHRCTLQANATSSIISGASTGQLLTVTWQQDGAGGRTYSWPANCRFAGGTAPSDTTASTRTTVSFEYDGSNWLELSRAVAVPAA